MNGTQSQTALREMRAHFSNSATLFALAAVAAVLTIVGPFGTADRMALLPRAAYWLVIVATTYAAGFGTDTLLRPRLPHRVAMVVNPLATGLIVTATVVVVNVIALGQSPGAEDWLITTVTIYAIAVIVSAAVQAVISSLRQAEPGAEAEDTPPPALLDRLTLEKRGPLVALSVEDHYVRVRTTQGEEMILMRLSDAIRETAPEAGLRVHRSHWVATGQVKAARRAGDRAILTMAHGGDIPVSRSHMQALKAAGLLPR